MLDGAAKITPMLAECWGCPRGDDRPRKHVRCREPYNSATKAGIKPIIGVEVI